MTERAEVMFQRVHQANQLIRILTVCILAIVLATSIAVYVQTQRAAAQLVEIARINQANLDRLVDCTTPGHSCYTQGQAQTSMAVKAIIDALHADHVRIESRLQGGKP